MHISPRSIDVSQLLFQSIENSSVPKASPVFRPSLKSVQIEHNMDPILVSDLPRLYLLVAWLPARASLAFLLSRTITSVIPWASRALVQKERYSKRGISDENGLANACSGSSCSTGWLFAILHVYHKQNWDTTFSCESQWLQRIEWVCENWILHVCYSKPFGR